jgi:hypothetical protein
MRLTAGGQSTLPNLRVSRKYTSGPPSSNSKRRLACGRRGRKLGCSSGASSRARWPRAGRGHRRARGETAAGHARGAARAAAVVERSEQVLAVPLEPTAVRPASALPQPSRRR